MSEVRNLCYTSTIPVRSIFCMCLKPRENELIVTVLINSRELQDIISFLPILISIADFPSAAAVVAGFRLLRIFRLQRFLSNYDTWMNLDGYIILPLVVDGIGAGNMRQAFHE